MTVLEFLSSQLDRERSEYDTQQVFAGDMEFWNLCIEAKRILIDEQLAKQEGKDDTHIK